MTDNTAGMIARRTDLLNEISEQLRAAVDEEDRPYRWEDIPDVLAEVIGERDALGAAQAGSLDNAAARREGYADALGDVFQVTTDMWEDGHQPTLAYIRGWAAATRDGLK